MMLLAIKTMNFELISRKNELCRGFIKFVFEKLKQDNDPSRNFDTVLQDVYSGDIWSCISEFFSDIIYDANEFSFEDYCNQNGGGFDDCVEYLQDFVEGIADFDLLRLCVDHPHETVDIGIDPHVFDVNNFYVPEE